MTEWVTVKEAAVLANRSRRAVYEWIEDKRLAVEYDSRGRMIVLRKSVIRIAPTVHRGRPRAVPRD